MRFYETCVDARWRGYSVGEQKKQGGVCARLAERICLRREAIGVWRRKNRFRTLLCGGGRHRIPDAAESGAFVSCVHCRRTRRLLGPYSVRERVMAQRRRPYVVAAGSGGPRPDGP